MVSRQETQRALMTPGEVMQMAPTDEVVMVSGVPPILAKKLRYFEDGNFTTRVVPPARKDAPRTTLETPWQDEAALPAAATAEVAALSDEGGRGLQHELDAPPPDPHPHADGPDPVPGGDDPADPADAQHLNTVRRAVALDAVDPDALPGY
jgi:type IV secretion system protein VirD4